MRQHILSRHQYRLQIFPALSNIWSLGGVVLHFTPYLPNKYQTRLKIFVVDKCANIFCHGINAKEKCFITWTAPGSWKFFHQMSYSVDHQRLYRHLPWAHTEGSTALPSLPVAHLRPMLWNFFPLSLTMRPNMLDHLSMSRGSSLV